MKQSVRQTINNKAIAERQRIRKWLMPHMVGSKAKAFTKEEYRQLTAADLGIFSKASFDHVWISAV